MRTHTEDCLEANDDTSVLKGPCICPKSRHEEWLVSRIANAYTKALARNPRCVIYDNIARAIHDCPEIVRIVSAHDELLRAAKEFLGASRFENHDTEKWPETSTLEKAIAKAEGK